MATSTENRTTAQQLADMPDDGNRYELVQGVLHMMSPAGGLHGRIAGKLLLRIASHVEQAQLGVTYAAETGFLLQRNPDTVRAPDVAFVSNQRLGAHRDQAGYLPLAPDLVAEVVSPNDRYSELEAKVKTWLNAGTAVVLVVDPQIAAVRVYRLPGEIRDHSQGRIDLQDVLPGFQLDVVELFRG